MSRLEAERAVRDAWIAGVIAIAATLLLTLIYSTGGGFGRLDRWNLLDLLIMTLLTIGIYRRNRASALIMPVYYLLVRVSLWWSERALIGVPVTLIFLYFFWRGYQGTRALHRPNGDPAGV